MRRLLIVALLAICTLGLAACSDGQPSCDEPVATTDVEMGDFFFAPLCIEVNDGATLSIANTGEARHTFTVSDTSLMLDLSSGEEGDLAITGAAAGIYEVTCNFHPQMTAALKVA